MIRAIPAFLLAFLSTLGMAGPLTRWTSQPLEGAHSLYVGGRETSALIVLRTGMDPLRSFDGGATWTTFTVAGKRPWGFRVSPTDARAWYAEAEAGGGVYRTRDGGDTWTPIQARSLSFEIGADPDLLVAMQPGPPIWDGTLSGPSPGLRVSLDGGQTWQNRDFPAPQYGYPVVSPVDSGVIVVFGAAKLLRSEDQGATWTTLVPPNPDGAPDGNVHALTLDRRDRSIAWLTTRREGDLWISRDSMASWTRVLRGRAVAFPDPLASGRAYALADNGDLLETRDGGASWVKVAAHDANVGAGPSSVVVKDGRRVAMAVRDSRLQQLDLTDGAVALGSDLWWKPSEAGAGLTITQHTSNRPFVVWYTYDATGAPVWRVIPGGTWSDRTLSGAMYETAGPAYFGAAFDPNAVTVRQVGAATLRFDDENNAVFSYSVGGVSGVKPITRQLFAAPAEPFPNLGNLADLWWNASESGWGVAINHQHNRVFATWYVYGADGKPLWVVMPDAVIGPEFAGAVVRAKATGDIYTTRGPAEGAPFDPAQVVPTKIGTATLHFRDSDEATLEYTAFGRTESRTITRQAF